VKRSLNIGLLIVLTVCGLSLWVGRGAPWPWRKDQGAPVQTAQEAVPKGLAPGLQVVVLNGTHVPGLARDFGLLLGRCGLAPVGYGNAAPQDYSRSFLVNRRLPPAKVTGLRNFLGGLPVLQEFDGRGTEDAVLVLGADQALLKAGINSRLP